MNADELNKQLQAYLAVRSALGFKDAARQTLLRNFVQYVIEHGNGGALRAHLAVDWACTASSSRGVSGQACRLTVARGFLAYLRATAPDTEVPDAGLLATPRRRLPFLFSPQQLSQLIEAALKIRPRGSLRPHTYATLLGLLSSTGLRVGEAIRLKVEEVSLGTDPATLHIRDTKFRKSRIVPLHPTTAMKLREYADRRDQMEYSGLCDAFFVSEQGKHLDYHSLWLWFRRTVKRSGIAALNEGRRPTLHSLRHGFAVERLTAWCQEGKPVQALVPHLSVYLGHVCPERTYWYLTATPALLLTAAEAFQRYANPGDKL